MRLELVGQTNDEPTNDASHNQTELHDDERPTKRRRESGPSFSSGAAQDQVAWVDMEDQMEESAADFEQRLMPDVPGYTDDTWASFTDNSNPVSSTWPSGSYQTHRGRGFHNTRIPTVLGIGVGPAFNLQPHNRPLMDFASAPPNAAPMSTAPATNNDAQDLQAFTPSLGERPANAPMSNGPQFNSNLSGYPARRVYSDPAPVPASNQFTYQQPSIPMSYSFPGAPGHPSFAPPTFDASNTGSMAQPEQGQMEANAPPGGDAPAAFDDNSPLQDPVPEYQPHFDFDFEAWLKEQDNNDQGQDQDTPLDFNDPSQPPSRFGQGSN